LSSFFFKFDLVKVFRRFQVNQDGLKLNAHIKFWFTLMVLIYWEEAYIMCRKNRNFISC